MGPQQPHQEFQFSHLLSLMVGEEVLRMRLSFVLSLESIQAEHFVRSNKYFISNFFDPPSDQVSVYIKRKTGFITFKVLKL